MFSKLILGVAIAGIAATPVLAQEVASKKKTKDPNRMVCRTEEVIGSRLQTKRTCLTASQWEQLERDQRQAVEKVQIFTSKSS